MYVIKGFLSEPADIEEAQSRVWSEASLVIGRFEGLAENEKKNLICAIARRRAIDVYRERIHYDYEPIENVAEYLTKHTDDKLAESIALSLASMDTDARELLMLRYKYGYSIDELSAIYQCSPVAMYKRIGRAKKKLAELLAEDGIDV